MTSPIGYNNPAYSHQFDSTLYDYQYVPEIDPDFEGHPNDRHERIHLVHPNPQDEFSGASEEFDASDESNQSIIVEQYNNRRVTLICEKRKPEERYYEDSNCRGAYHHDISLESENDYRASCVNGKENEFISVRHQRKLDPPVESSVGCRNEYDPTSNRQLPTSRNLVQYQRRHRYEEIGGDDDYQDESNHRMKMVSHHRYAEITVDENGYPSIGNEIEIEHSDVGYRVVNMESQPRPKPRAPSPVSDSFSPTFSPSKTYQRTISPRPSVIEVNITRMHPSNPKPVPIPPSVIEMAELSPPRSVTHGKPQQAPFFQSPKRHPPIGASASGDVREQIKSPNGKTQRAIKSGHKRQNSSHNIREATHARNVTPNKPKASVTQMFQAKTTPKTSATLTPKGKSNHEGERNSIRRNISNSFTDPPSDMRSPYRPTTIEMSKTAIITPILQRKNKKSETLSDEDENFQRISHMFQSTGNLYKAGKENHGNKIHRPAEAKDKSRMKRNQSVPNFAQSFLDEGNVEHFAPMEYRAEGRKPQRKLDYQYSPAKSVDRFSPISRSRLSLIDKSKLSWSHSSGDFQVRNSGCLVVGAIILIITSITSCAICFYLFSKLGRRYYLDFGILAGFVNLVLGVLGFRSQCWRWLPNRNYVSGYIVLTNFSIIACAGFIYLITARPMSGDPILDLIGGGICGVSVLTIILSITGLTMSGCCKAPPPDNRVNNI